MTDVPNNQINNEPSLKTTTSESTGPPSSQSDRFVGPFGIEPSHVFFLASLPLCIGAYSGFQKQVKQAEKEAKEAAKRNALEKAGKTLPPLKFSVDAHTLAGRAFGIATMLSLGSFAAVAAVSFYACGYRSFQEAFDSSRSWGLKRRAGIEGWAKLDFSKDDPDMIATQHMSEDEEMDYIHEKYLSEEIIEKDPRTNAISKWLEWMRWQKS